MSDVFISYSRKDGEFAKRLTNAFKRSERDVWIDWEDIPRGADWLQEIFSGIEAADAFVFIVSQHSLTSEICNDELAYARKHNKRIVPLIRQEIKNEAEQYVKAQWFDATWQKLAQENWAEIGHLNWIFFDNDEKFDSEFEALIETIETDLVHVKLHTRFLVRARDWEIGGNNPSFLLTGDEIDSAETWLADSADKSPEATELHREYITASRERDLSEKRRLRNLRNTSIVAAVVGVLAIILTIVSALSAVNASNRSATAEVAANNAETQGHEAGLQRDEALAIGTQVGAEATFFALQQDYLVQLAAGGAVISLSDLEQVPNLFIATITAVAETIDSVPIVESFNCDDGFCIEMVLIPSGCFWMGSIGEPDEQPVHEVCFEQEFYIDRYEVTNEQFEALGGSAENDPVFTEPRHPRTNINWQEAYDFCLLRGARLPNEMEWEYAARGPNSYLYPWGNEFNREYVVFKEKSNNLIAQIGSRPVGVSWVSAYDMAGNAMEWTSTLYQPYPINDSMLIFDYGSTLNDIYTVRGGAFNQGANEMRSAERIWYGSGVAQFGFDQGFRCVRDDISDETTQIFVTATIGQSMTPATTQIQSTITRIPLTSSSPPSNTPLGTGCGDGVLGRCRPTQAEGGGG